MKRKLLDNRRKNKAKKRPEKIRIGDIRTDEEGYRHKVIGVQESRRKITLQLNPLRPFKPVKFPHSFKIKENNGKFSKVTVDCQ